MTNQTTNKKLLDQVRDTLRLKHYALSTEESYLLWIKRYIVFHIRQLPLKHQPPPSHPRSGGGLTLRVTGLHWGNQRQGVEY